VVGAGWGGRDSTVRLVSRPAGYWVDQYVQDLRTRKLSPHTEKAYRSDLLEVLTLIAAPLDCPPAEVAVSSLTREAVRSGFARFALTRSAASVARAWSTWNGWFAFLLLHNVVEGNPMQAIRRPKGSVKRPKPLRGEDSPERLLATVAAPIVGARTGWPCRDLAAVALLLCTGVRSSELLALTVSDIAGRPGGHRIGVRDKGGTFRTIPIDDSLHTLLADYLANRRERFGPTKPGDALFVDTHGEPLRRGGLQYLISRALRAAGVHDQVPAGAAVHALRHTFATRLAEDGATAADIAALLGHASLTTSQAYIDASGREQRRAVLGQRTTRIVRTLVDVHD
jgi:integrase/recombinase XerD